MPKTISADGQTYVVPDDATDEEINQIVGPGPQPKEQPQPSTAQNFGSGFLEGVNPFRGVDTLLEHPLETIGNTAKEVFLHPYMAAGRAYEAAKEGRPEEAAAHLGNALMPAGFATEEAETKAATPGQRAEGYGQLLGQLTQAGLMAKGATPENAAALKGGAKTGVSQIRPVLSDFNITHPLKSVPDIYDALKEIGRGGKQAASDYRAVQRVGQVRTPAYAKIPPALPVAEPAPTELPVAALPSGRVPGPAPARPAAPPKPARIPIGANLPEPQPLDVRAIEPIVPVGRTLPSGRVVPLPGSMAETQPAPPSPKPPITESRVDQLLGDLRERYGLPRGPSPLPKGVQERWDEGGPSPTIRSTRPQVKNIKPEDSGLNGKALEAAKALSREMRKKK